VVDSHSFVAGDAFSVEPSQILELKVKSKLEALWFELPVQH
jgi:hypothetical protein